MFLAAGQIHAKVVYTPMNLTANQTSTWNWFEFGVDANGFGLWVNAGSALRLETYVSPVIGVDDGGKVYLTGLDYEAEIGAGSAWVTPATPSYINDATHQALNGKTFYVGVQLITAESVVHYGWMKLSVAADGLSVTLEGMAYQDEAGVSLKAGLIDRQVYYSKTEFREDLTANDGTMGAPVFINLEGVEFSVASGAFAQGTHYTLENLPEGLGMEIAVTDSKHAVISLAGIAAAHSEADSRYDLTINFLDAAFAGAQASAVIDAAKNDLTVKFFDPYKIVYEDPDDLVCGVNGWAPFANYYYGNEFGLWHDGTDMRLETYAKSVIGTKNLGKTLITPLEDGTLINSESAWATTGNWPDEPYINTATYTDWNGKHRYAGIQLVVDDAILYGWLNLEVSSDGKTVTLRDWAFNTMPQGPIRAGEKSSGIPNSTIQAIELNISPNPFTSNLVISFSQSLKDAASLEILDIAGRVMHQEILKIDGNTRMSVNAENLSPGIYFLKIRSKELNATRKIIKD